jgi:hypothetical protein
MRYRVALRIECNSTLQAILSFENLDGAVDLGAPDGVVAGIRFPRRPTAAGSDLAPDVLPFASSEAVQVLGIGKSLDQKAARAMPHRACFEER